METISHLNIQVDGVPFSKITQIQIQHSINEHGTAVVIGEIPSSEADRYLARVNEKEAITIRTTASGQPPVLFYGVIMNVGVQAMSEYTVLSLTCVSTSCLLDVGKINRSYQNTGDTYSAVMKKSLDGEALLEMNVTDAVVGKMIIQCNETKWEFCKRMASMLSAPVIASIDSNRPVLSIGIPAKAKTYDLSQMETSSGEKEHKPFTTMGQGVTGTCIQTTQYLSVGAAIRYKNVEQKVKSLSCTFEKGVLLTNICIDSVQGFVQPQVSNVQISGKMYTGQVQGVKKDMVQVHLVDIDKEYDGGGDVWLPYSTAYSSGDGSGFYCMPAEGDMVRVFFPGSDEGRAFAASSVCVSPGANVTDKQWRGPNGKQILLTEDGIYITTNADDSKIFIDLTDDEGIMISSNKNINICAKNNLSLISNNAISMTAQNDILISTAESYIDINPEGIEVGAENIVIK